jgi:hypothetical protein
MVSIAIGPVSSRDGAARVPSTTDTLPQGRRRGNGAKLALRLLLASAFWSPASALDGLAAEELPTVELRWTAPDRTTYAVAVPQPGLDLFLRERDHNLTAEGGRLVAIADLALAAEAAPVLNALLLRVPDYVDWVYGWIDGYIAAFKVIGRAVHSLATGERADLFSTAMRAVGGAELQRLVIEPARPAARMAAALARLDGILADEWRRLLARDQARWRAFLGKHAGSARRVSAGAGADVGQCVAAEPSASGEVLDEGAVAAAGVNGQSELYVWRITRPFATRLGALATRLAVGASSLAGTTILGFGNPTTAGGVALSFAATSSAVWSIDYGLNRLDRALHSDLLSAQVSEGLAAAMATQERTLSEHVSARIAAAVVDLAACAERLQPVIARGS